LLPSPLGSNGFCLVAALPGETALLAFAPRTGAVLATVPNVERSMSTTPGLYQTTASPSVLTRVHIPGGERWVSKFTQLFGPGYDPDYGWDFNQFGSMDVGTIGAKPVANKQSLSAARTVGLSDATGRPKWKVPGLFDCGGAPTVVAPYICLMTGTISPTPGGTPTTSKNATVTLEGFDAETGRITWRVPAAGVTDLLLGNVEIKDADHILVRAARGGKTVLDLRSGATAPATSDDVFWCAHTNVFSIRPPSGIGAQRLGSSFFEPCDGNGRPTTSASHPPSLVGASVGHTFVWASAGGLEAASQ
jgi:hypothetical protein